MFGTRAFKPEWVLERDSPDCIQGGGDWQFGVGDAVISSALLSSVLGAAVRRAVLQGEPVAPVAKERPVVLQGEPVAPVAKERPVVLRDEPAAPVAKERPVVLQGEPAAPVAGERPVVLRDEPAAPIAKERPVVLQGEVQAAGPVLDALLQLRSGAPYFLAQVDSVERAELRDRLAAAVFVGAALVDG